MSIIILTYNEERNIGACLQSLADQSRRDFEVIVIDAASKDRTADIVRAVAAGFPVPLRLEVAATRISVGEARNRGARLSEATFCAYLSADTEAEPDWVDHALRQAERFDLIYGRQVHAPTRVSVGSAVRGLRYHFPDGPADEPVRYASHVNAVIRRSVLLAYPVGTTPGASAVDDVLLARRAVRAGYRVTYEPKMVVRHHDVDSWRAELTKNRREGLGLGEYSHELGAQKAVLGWGALLLVALLFLAFRPAIWTIGVFLALLWLPALRRAAKHIGQMPPAALFLGLLAAPLFDLAFLLAYVRGLLLPNSGRSDPAPSTEVET